jgi:hypothetical protein
MKIFILALALLTGCSTTVPITQPWPEAPGMQSVQACGPLQPLPETATITQAAKTIATNYTEYYVCATKLEAWQEWYQKQKLIHEGLR